MPVFLAFGLGIVAGLRAMTAIAAVSWAARLGWIDLHQTFLSFLHASSATYILTGLAVLELVNDKLPITPSRLATGPFAARILSGALSGAAICAGLGASLAGGLIAGALGAVAGSYGGYHARQALVHGLPVKDIVIAVLEDIVAIGSALFLVSRH